MGHVDFPRTIFGHILEIDNFCRVRGNVLRGKLCISLALVRLAAGLFALVHVTCMCWSRRSAKTSFRSGVRTQYGNKARRKRERGAGVGTWVAGRAVLCDRHTGIPGLEHICNLFVHKVSRFLHDFIANCRNICVVLLARIFYVSRFGLSVIGFRMFYRHFAYHVLEVKITRG